MDSRYVRGLEQLIEAARLHALRVKNDPTYKPYEELIKRKEKEYRENSYVLSETCSFII